MDTKIQELTDKIYREGVEKGKEEAARIITGANEQRQIMLQEAKAEAQSIIATAEKQAATLKKNAEAELKLFAARFVEGIKSEIANLVTDKIIASNVSPLAQDTAFMQKIVLEIAQKWDADKGLTVQTNDAASLIEYFKANAKYLLDRGIRIEQVNGKPQSFTIAPADNSYKIAFGEEEFTAFFKEYLRPQLSALLF
jgi:V/A-type H+-transporting ATPase subunit E